MSETALEQEFLRVGDVLPVHVRGPITRTTLALFAGASNDHNPLHVDIDHAKAMGMEDVIAPGMLVMAYVGQQLTSIVPQERLRRWSVRFTAITPVHASIHCHAEVAQIFEENGERVARLKLVAMTERSVKVLEGEAIVSLG